MGNFKYLGIDMNNLIEKEDVPDFRVEKFLIWYNEEFPGGVNTVGILEESFRFICFKGYLAGVADKYVDGSLLTPPPTVEYSPSRRNKL